MAQLSDDLHDQPSQVEGGVGVGRGQGNELQTPDGEGCAGVVWFSFESLDKTFGIESDGPRGYWADPTPVGWGPTGSKYPRDEAWRKSISDAKKGRDSNRGKPVLYKGKWYKSQAEAARQCGCSKNTVARALGKSYGYRSEASKERRRKGLIS